MHYQISAEDMVKVINSDQCVRTCKGGVQTSCTKEDGNKDVQHKHFDDPLPICIDPYCSTLQLRYMGIVHAYMCCTWMNKGTSENNLPFILPHKVMKNINLKQKYPLISSKVLFWR